MEGLVLFNQFSEITKLKGQIIGTAIKVSGSFFMNVISATGLAIVILISLLVCYILLRIVKAKRLKSRIRDIHGKPIPESKNTSFEGVQDSDGLTTFSFFGSENIKVNTRELVREVMSTKSDKLLRWVWFVPKGSLFPSEGDDEKRHRKIVSTSMKKDHVQTMKSMVKKQIVM